MSWIDFLIGLTLVNALPHFVLGVWKGGMLSAFGVGHGKNIAYGSLNLAISAALFLSTYGVEGLATHGVYAGGLFVVLAYFATGRYWYRRFGAVPRP